MNLNELIYPELYILIPVLYLMGMYIKKSSVSDRLIPAILGIMGILLSCAYLIAGGAPGSFSEVMSVLFAGITQGILCASASVYANNLIKQATKSDDAKLAADGTIIGGNKENEKDDIGNG